MSERPIECSQCKKPVSILYKEVDREVLNQMHCCTECPVLRKILQQELEQVPGINLENSALCCGGCSTTLESIRMGNLLGCPECYSVFAEVISEELILADKIPEKLKGIRKTLHLGKTPRQDSSNFTPSSHLVILNQALKEALNKENYEQAALIRDQIKTLMRTSHATES